MTARIAKKKNKDGSVREYIQIIQAYRPKGKKYSTQRVIASLGRADKIKPEQLKVLINALKRIAKISDSFDPKSDIFLHDAINYGVKVIFDHIWKKIKMDEILHSLEVSQSAIESVKMMVLTRIEEFTSKRECQCFSKQYLLPHEHDWSLSTYYRSMDQIMPVIKQIEDSLFKKNYENSNQYELFDDQNLDLVFFDTTSVKIKVKIDESSAAGLFHHGYSKDHRPDIPQFIVGLVVSGNNDPIAHYILPGNYSDQRSFKIAIDDIYKRFPIKRLIFVSDRGCVNEELLSWIKAKNMEYIVGAKMRNVKLFRNMIIDNSNDFEDYDDNLSFKEIHHDNERFVIVKNEYMTTYDRNTREKQIDKLTQLSGRSLKHLAGNRGYKKYLRSTGSISIDPAKVEQDAHFDGKWLLRSNVSDFSPSDLIEGYKSLWRVEQWFNSLKNQFNVDPVFHREPQRVLSHVFICFLAMKVWSYFRNHITLKHPNVSSTDSWRSLSKLKAATMTIANNDMFIRSDIPEDVLMIFKALRAKIPERARLLESTVCDPKSG